MAAKPALIRQGDVTRILKGAAAAGISMGIVVTPGEVRFVPIDTQKPEQQLSDLDQWRAKRDARQAKEAARLRGLGLDPDAPKTGRGRTKARGAL
ncbi:hypothetical protein [Devosia sp. 1635]|uniref:hypothetical protein n=1 Tax=Devosia sp. 1635 TaxID=2726066 RepID=UPI001566FCBD|nr:hypothetical protein [Devosia sp. 1635]